MRTDMSPIIHDPENKLKIDAVWLFVSRDENGNEGLLAAPLGETFMPLVAADPDRVESLRIIAQKMAQMTKKKVHLIKFSVKEEIETIG